VLPAVSRMRRSGEFTETVRRGARAGRRSLSAHLLARPDVPEPPRVGFVVSRAVGGAVVRNRVRRRLRHAARGYLQWLPDGSLLVVRANPRAATARQAELAVELGQVIEVLVRRQVGSDGSSGLGGPGRPGWSRWPSGAMRR
jgi:ribonuclease P protein component